MQSVIAFRHWRQNFFYFKKISIPFIPRTHHKQFPKPTELVMITTTFQWMTFTMKITCCPVYQIPILISPKKLTVEHAIELLEKFQVSQ